MPVEKPTPIKWYEHIIKSKWEAVCFLVFVVVALFFFIVHHSSPQTEQSKVETIITHPTLPQKVQSQVVNATNGTSSLVGILTGLYEPYGFDVTFTGSDYDENTQYSVDFGDGESMSVYPQTVGHDRDKIAASHYYKEEGTYAVSVTDPGGKLVSTTSVKVKAEDAVQNATIDPASLESDSPTPTISGTLEGVPVMRLVIDNSSRLTLDTGPTIGGVEITNGKWTATLATVALPPGQYHVEVTGIRHGTVLAKGLLNVLPTEQWGPCTYVCKNNIPVILSVSPREGPVGTEVTITGMNFSTTTRGWGQFYVFDSSSLRVEKKGTIMKVTVGSEVPVIASGGNSGTHMGSMHTWPGPYYFYFSNETNGVQVSSSDASFTVTK